MDIGKWSMRFQKKKELNLNNNAIEAFCLYANSTTSEDQEEGSIIYGRPSVINLNMFADKSILRLQTKVKYYGMSDDFYFWLCIIENEEDCKVFMFNGDFSKKLKEWVKNPEYVGVLEVIMK